MREKARRMMLLILLSTGSWKAYPQYSFPTNLIAAENAWSMMYTLPDREVTSGTLNTWDNHSQTSLSPDQLQALTKLMSVWGYQMKMLPKLEQQFLSKHGHIALYLSGFNPHASSSFDRSGPWMLTFPDARRYGLVVNEWVDERRDFAKSTRAARLLFEELKEIHGANTESVFVFGAAGWKRTSQAVIDQAEQQLTALRILSRNVKPTNLTVVKPTGAPQSFQEDIDVSLLLTELAVTEAQFRSWNPAIIGSKVPAHQQVSLPTILDSHALANASRLLAQTNKRTQDSLMLRVKNNIPSANTHQVTTYRVKSGDVLGRIADRHGVSVANIKKWNNLKSDRIDINQKLTIYLPKGKSTPTEEIATPVEPPVAKQVAKPLTDEKGTFTIYEVQPGDTLWAISKRFEGVKPEQIMAWNGIGEALSIGQKLKIKVFQ